CNCPRSLSSPTPALCLIADDNGDREWLNGIERIGDSKPVAHITTEFTIPFDTVMNNVNDRFDGLALLTEAGLASAAGQFHEYYRLFERGFKATGPKLGRLLVQFLAPTRMAITVKEVDRWIEIRDPLTHAD